MFHSYLCFLAVFRAFLFAIMSKRTFSRQRYYFFRIYASARRIFLRKSYILPLFLLLFPFVIPLYATYLPSTLFLKTINLIYYPPPNITCLYTLHSSRYTLHQKKHPPRQFFLHISKKNTTFVAKLGTSNERLLQHVYILPHILRRRAIALPYSVMADLLANSTISAS